MEPSRSRVRLRLLGAGCLTRRGSSRSADESREGGGGETRWGNSFSKQHAAGDESEHAPAGYRQLYTGSYGPTSTSPVPLFA